jgi:hypothetical protein
MYDMDNDGVISKNELVAFLTLMVGSNVSQEQLDSIADRYLPGLPDFSWCIIPTPEKLCPLNKKCGEWSQDIPNVPTIFQRVIKYVNIFQSKALNKF